MGDYIINLLHYHLTTELKEKNKNIWQKKKINGVDQSPINLKTKILNIKIFKN